MKIPYRKTLIFLCFFGFCILTAEFLSRPVNSEVEPSISVALSGNEVIGGYKQWTLVNPEPQRIDPVDAGLCRAPLPIDLAHMEGGPHVGKFISVYVNEIGKVAMMEQREPRFPEGSVIVKEKLSKGPTMVGFSPIELLTVMRKREAGYDPNKGDWEYLVFDGSGKTLQASGKLANCQACHTRFEQADYIARTYLTVEARQKLR